MIRHGLVAVVALAGCNSQEWKPRASDAYVVTAPRDPKVHTNTDVPAGAMGPIEVRVYLADDKRTLQVQVVEVPPDVDPTRALADLRNAVVSRGGTIVTETPADLGDVTGYDVTYSIDTPLSANMRFRTRFLFHDHHAYQVMSVRHGDDDGGGVFDADAKRFVESFAFTTPKQELDPLLALGAPANSAKVHPHAPAPIGKDGWVAAHSTEGKFSVRLPGQYIDADVAREKMGQAMHVLLADRGSDHTRFSAVCVPSDGTPAAVRVQTYAAESVKHLPGVTRTDLDVRGNPATDLVDAHRHTRLLASDAFTCILQVEALSEGNPVPTADGLTMFDSLVRDEDHGEEALPRR